MYPSGNKGAGVDPSQDYTMLLDLSSPVARAGGRERGAVAAGGRPRALRLERGQLTGVHNADGPMRSLVRGRGGSQPGVGLNGTVRQRDLGTQRCWAREP